MQLRYAISETFSIGKILALFTITLPDSCWICSHPLSPALAHSCPLSPALACSRPLSPALARSQPLSPILGGSHMLLPTFARSCQLCPALARSCPLFPALAHSCTLLQALPRSCPLLPTLACSCPLLPTCTERLLGINWGSKQLADPFYPQQLINGEFLLAKNVQHPPKAIATIHLTPIQFSNASLYPIMSAIGKTG